LGPDSPLWCSGRDRGKKDKGGPGPATSGFWDSRSVRNKGGGLGVFFANGKKIAGGPRPEKTGAGRVDRRGLRIPVRRGPRRWPGERDAGFYFIFSHRIFSKTKTKKRGRGGSGRASWKFVGAGLAPPGQTTKQACLIPKEAASDFCFSRQFFHPKPGAPNFVVARPNKPSAPPSIFQGGKIPGAFCRPPPWAGLMGFREEMGRGRFFSVRHAY